MRHGCLGRPRADGPGPALPDVPQLGGCHCPCRGARPAMAQGLREHQAQARQPPPATASAIRDCHFACFALRCRILISNWDQEMGYFMGNPVLRKVKLLSELSILIKVDLRIHLADWKINISFDNAQNDKTYWRPASNPNPLEIMFTTTVWVFLRKTDEEKPLAHLLPLCYRNDTASTVREIKA